MPVRNITQRLFKRSKSYNYSNLSYQSDSGLLIRTHLISGLASLLIGLAGLTACSAPQSGYFPLSKGYSWEYEEILTIRNEAFPRRKVIQSVGLVEIHDQPVYLHEIQGETRAFYERRDEGIYRVSADLEHRELVFPLPINEALESKRTWTIPSRLGVIESRTFALEDRILNRPPKLNLTFHVVSLDETIQTQAGTFNNCLLIKGEGEVNVRTDRGNNSAIVHVINKDWYAPGVGLVKTERTEKAETTFLNAGLYELELLSY